MNDNANLDNAISEFSTAETAFSDHVAATTKPEAALGRIITGDVLLTMAMSLTILVSAFDAITTHSSASCGAVALWSVILGTHLRACRLEKLVGVAGR